MKHTKLFVLPTIIATAFLFPQKLSSMQNNTWGDGTPQDPYAIGRTPTPTTHHPVQQSSQANTWGDGTPQDPYAIGRTPTPTTHHPVQQNSQLSDEEYRRQLADMASRKNIMTPYGMDILDCQDEILTYKPEDDHSTDEDDS